METKLDIEDMNLKAGSLASYFNIPEKNYPELLKSVVALYAHKNNGSGGNCIISALEKVINEYSAGGRNYVEFNNNFSRETKTGFTGHFNYNTYSNGSDDPGNVVTTRSYDLEVEFLENGKVRVRIGTYQKGHKLLDTLNENGSIIVELNKGKIESVKISESNQNYNLVPFVKPNEELLSSINDVCKSIDERFKEIQAVDAPQKN